ncbi:MAG: endonuclease/exonuclease/phosphatase family protein [Candidatus Hydrogenedentes bacterium]|nr:endonuclease/exonuclease/phosphatase family protein [Candidatus Hydrogenedentota bacterium]
MERLKKFLFWSVFIFSPIVVLVGGFILLAIYSENYNPEPRNFLESVYKNTKREPLSKPVTLKIITFNIQNTWVVGLNRQERMEAIARTLAELDPDLVGFQEAFVPQERQILIDKIKTSSRLQYHHYFRSGLVGSGKLTMSAYPIREVFFYRYKVTGDWYKFWEGDWWAGKGCALARIEIPEVGVVDFYNTHIQAGYGNPFYRKVKEAQCKELAEFINASCWLEHLVILVGDLNTRIGDVAHDTLVVLANLTRLMNMDSNIDHIYGKSSPMYQFEVLDTIPLIYGRTPEGKEIRLSDHYGFMSTVKVTPTLSKTS